LNTYNDDKSQPSKEEQSQPSTKFNKQKNIFFISAYDLIDSNVIKTNTPNHYISKPVCTAIREIEFVDLVQGLVEYGNENVFQCFTLTLQMDHDESSKIMR
jgi:hypothetical protein